MQTFDRNFASLRANASYSDAPSRRRGEPPLARLGCGPAHDGIPNLRPHPLTGVADEVENDAAPVPIRPLRSEGQGKRLVRAETLAQYSWH